MHGGFTAAAVALADHERPGWWRRGLDDPPTEAERRFRARQLTLAGRLLAEGRVIEPGWLRAQVLDLRDVLVEQGG